LMNQVRLQLFWLTENSTGRIKDLFEKDAMLAARVLLHFTVDLDMIDEEQVADSYAAPAKKVPVPEPTLVTYDRGSDHAETYDLKPLPHDGHFGFSVFRETSRQQIVTALRRMMANDDVVFIRPSGDSEAEDIGYNARDFIAHEIMHLLMDETFRAAVPKVFSERPLSDGLDILDRLSQLSAKVESTCLWVLAYVPGEQQNGIQSVNDLIHYLEENANPLTGVEGPVVDFRAGAVRTLQQLKEQRVRARVQTDHDLFQFCQRPDVIKAYLEYGVNFTLPLGARTAALYAASQGMPVEIFSDRAHEGQLQLEVQHTGSGQPIFRILLGQHWCHWLKVQTPLEAPAEVHGFAPAFIPRSHGVSDVALQKHPMAVHAHGLFWSVGNSEQQTRIAQMMEIGHKQLPIDGDRGSTRFLLALDTPENIEAIKVGVLQSRSLEALLPKLRNAETRNNAFAVLAVLFSDPEHGIDFQRCFRQLLQAHRSELYDDHLIGRFLDWLEGTSRRDIDPAIVRARFAAVILMEANSKTAKDADKRGKLLWTYMQSEHSFYPKDDLLTAMGRLAPAFESEDECKARRRIFCLMFRNRMLQQKQDAVADLSFVTPSTSALRPTTGFKSPARLISNWNASAYPAILS